MFATGGAGAARGVGSGAGVAAHAAKHIRSAGAFMLAPGAAHRLVIARVSRDAFSNARSACVA